ncbi:hypothetical protein PM082_022766 [Marasmius tenuissimus]|nr:hypothetical protein PM082_022766 [Marasmius tenuissimus]
MAATELSRSNYEAKNSVEPGCRRKSVSAWYAALVLGNGRGTEEDANRRDNWSRELGVPSSITSVRRTAKEAPSSATTCHVDTIHLQRSTTVSLPLGNCVKAALSAPRGVAIAQGPHRSESTGKDGRRLQICGGLDAPSTPWLTPRSKGRPEGVARRERPREIEIGSLPAARRRDRLTTTWRDRGDLGRRSQHGAERALSERDPL